ncbi:MAG: GTP 3',8-cyclase MoaA, partial [Acidimicrobiales bacterium]|nr:GTP 3',8-cyclase MoaA [Acidimicrobiales bacterium]
MPAEGLDWLPRAELLTFEEIERVARLLVQRYGIDSIRLTGGEPTVRANLPRLVKMLAGLDVDLALTTNGATLRLAASKLAAAGLKRINVSLDSLRPDRFTELTLRNELDSVLEGIDAALDAGLNPLKINVVVMRDVNDDELVDFARFGRDKGVVVRFIEFMPLDADKAWTNQKVVGVEEIVARVAEVFPLEPIPRTSAPASRFRYLDGGGEIGVVASVTQSFCDSCDRIRLTADGQFRNCLFAVDEFDVRSLLRSGADDEQILGLMERAVTAKWAGHGIGRVEFIRPTRSMSQIGG